MAGIKTTNLGGGGGLPKFLQPGNTSCKIESIYLEKDKFNEQGYFIMLQLEGPDMGEGFEGFLIDKDDPSKGMYKGQIGKVKTHEYSYKDGVIPMTGAVVERDKDILRMINAICKETESLKWLEEQDGKHEKIESLVETLNKDKPFAGKYLRFCIAGREYESKGYTNYELFLPKMTRVQVPFESETREESNSKVPKFDRDIHIKKKKTSSVDKFDGVPDSSKSSPSAEAKDFDL